MQDVNQQAYQAYKIWLQGEPPDEEESEAFISGYMVAYTMLTGTE